MKFTQWLLCCPIYHFLSLATCTHAHKLWVLIGLFLTFEEMLKTLCFFTTKYFGVYLTSTDLVPYKHGTVMKIKKFDMDAILMLHLESENKLRT